MSNPSVRKTSIVKHSIRKLIPSLAGVALVMVSTLSTLAGESYAAAPTLVKVAHQSQFGQILITPKQQALYYFTPEKDGKIHCTGGCATVWPPLLVRNGTTVAAHIPGAMGRFGVIVRPDHTRQITFQGKPLYTYTGDVKPLQVLCNGVGGWYVVKIH